MVLEAGRGPVECRGRALLGSGRRSPAVRAGGSSSYRKAQRVTERRRSTAGRAGCRPPRARRSLVRLTGAPPSQRNARRGGRRREARKQRSGSSARRRAGEQKQVCVSVWHGQPMLPCVEGPCPAVSLNFLRPGVPPRNHMRNVRICTSPGVAAGQAFLWGRRFQSGVDLRSRRRFGNFSRTNPSARPPRGG